MACSRYENFCSLSWSEALNWLFKVHVTEENSPGGASNFSHNKFWWIPEQIKLWKSSSQLCVALSFQLCTQGCDVTAPHEIFSHCEAFWRFFKSFSYNIIWVERKLNVFY